MLTFATEGASACSSGIESGASKASEFATTRSPRLTPETTSTKLGSLSPSSTRFHSQDELCAAGGDGWWRAT